MIITRTLFSHRVRRHMATPHAAVIAASVLLVPICVFWVDRPLADHVAAWLPPSRTLPGVPDLLAPFVAVISSLMLLVWAWTWLTGRRHTRLARLAPLLTFGLPASFGLKILAKWIFGRTEARMYLSTYHACDFCHWLDGHGPFTGFPSGHMLVATATLALVCACYPRLKRVSAVLLAALAIALILTSYHFLSDAIAGCLFGYALARFMLLADTALRLAATSRKPS